MKHTDVTLLPLTAEDREQFMEMMKPPLGLVNRVAASFFVLFSAIGCDNIADVGGGAWSVFIDVVFETFVGHVHLTQSCEDFIGAGVVVLSDVIL